MIYKLNIAFMLRILQYDLGSNMVTQIVLYNYNAVVESVAIRWDSSARANNHKPKTN